MTLDCIVCGKTLEPIFRDMEPGVNQPSAGTFFVSYGQYGSTIFDPMDGQFIEVNICDECLFAKSGKDQNVIALGRSHENIRDETMRQRPVIGQRRLELHEVPDLVPWHGQEYETSGQSIGEPKEDERNSMGGDAHAAGESEATTTTVETPDSTTTVEAGGSASTEDTSSENTAASDSSDSE